MITSLAVVFVRAGEKPEAGFVSLFDGKTLAGWDGDPKFWAVKDGAVTGQTTEENATKHNQLPPQTPYIVAAVLCLEHD